MGRTALHWTEESLRLAPRDIADSGLDCLDITYSTLTEVPVDTVRGIYAHFGWEFTPAYQAALEAYVLTNRREREAMAAKKTSSPHEGSGHTYSLADYGITEEELQRGVFKEYSEKYLAPTSPARKDKTSMPALSAATSSLPLPPSPPCNQAPLAGQSTEERVLVAHSEAEMDAKVEGKKEGKEAGASAFSGERPAWKRTGTEPKARRNTPVRPLSPLVSKCAADRLGRSDLARSSSKCHIES